MILPWILFFASLGAVIVSVVLLVVTDSDGWLVLLFLTGLAAVMFLIGGCVVGLGRHYGRVECHTFAQQTHRQTRFVIYHAWDGGDCLTPDGTGKWIPTKNLREFGSAS